MDPNPPWRAIPLGTRVTVRARHPEGGYSDAVGELTARTDQALTVATRRGPRIIPVDLIAIIHIIEPKRV
jgi:hypothetical protein